MDDRPSKSSIDRRILGVFAHPDDETTACAGTFSRYAAEGVGIWVVTATRGEQGTLGTGGMAISREELPMVREQEQRAVAEQLGVRGVLYLGYRDAEVKDAPYPEVMARLLEEMGRVQPDVVITFGPQGISHHDDHVVISRAATEAFHRYAEGRGGARGAALYYVALPKEVAVQFEIELDGVETEPTVVIDIAPRRALKVQALRMYRSQEDAQEVAQSFEAMPFAAFEYFHRAYPPSVDGSIKTAFW